MTKKALERKLNELNIDKRAYDLNGGLPNETYCIEESNGKWYTYYSERGKRTSFNSFETEEEACQYFWIGSSIFFISETLQSLKKSITRQTGRIQYWQNETSTHKKRKTGSTALRGSSPFLCLLSAALFFWGFSSFFLSLCSNPQAFLLCSERERSVCWDWCCFSR